MANKRIKDLTQTATTLASDDYVAIDGSSNGTRKIVKSDLVNDISSQVAGTYLDEANNLSDVASLDTSKLNLEVPDVGTAPNEVPLNGMLGSMAYQSSESVSMAKAEIESTTGTATTQALTVTDGTDTNFVVQEDGKTGIGGVTPSTTLHIRSDSDKNLELGTLGNKASIAALNDARSAYVDMRIDADNLIIGNYSGGKVGIGTASPGSYNAAANSLVVGDHTTNRGITIASSSAHTGYLFFADGTGANAYRGRVAYNHAADQLYLGAGGSTSWKIDGATGNLIAVQSGAAIDFGSGATLSDYEEGTHTTAATPSSSGTITLDASSNSLSYTRVGRKITVSGALGVSAVSSPVGNYINFTLPLQIADLDELSGHFAGSCVVLNAAGSMGSYSIIGLDGESSFRLYKNTNTSAVATAPDFSGDETIYVSVTYFTTA